MQNQENENKKIFIIEDDTMILGYLETLLKHFKYNVLTLSNGSNAYAKILEEIPDLVLLDITLPDIDGLTICQNLRSNPATKNIPVIILTCLSDEQTIRKATECGATDFISKPFNQISLMSKIKQFIKK